MIPSNDTMRFILPSSSSLQSCNTSMSKMKITTTRVYISLQTKLYKEDWIGLRTLDEAGKVKFINVSGNHLKISRSDMKKYIAPYLEDQASAPTEQAMTEPSSYEWLSRRWYLFKDLIGLNEDQPLLHTTY